MTDVYRYFDCNLGLAADVADELTHQTFIAVWESLDSFQERSSPKGWILGIARNIGRSAFRTKRRLALNDALHEDLRRETSQWGPGASTPQELLERKRNFEALEDIVATLPEKKREVFELRYLQQFSVDELAVLLDEPKETIRSRLRFAREEVKVRWIQKTKNKSS